MNNTIQSEIESCLARSAPDVEVLLVELHGDTLRVFIDHPEGVTLDLCERVTLLLAEFRERYALEVSSPGQDRPLTRPAHYSRFLGRRAKVRLREAAASTGEALPSQLAGHRSVTGELVGASPQEVTIAAPEGVVAIPYSQIVRSNLVPGD